MGLRSGVSHTARPRVLAHGVLKQRGCLATPCCTHRTAIRTGELGPSSRSPHGVLLPCTGVAQHLRVKRKPICAGATRFARVAGETATGVAVSIERQTGDRLPLDANTVH